MKTKLSQVGEFGLIARMERILGKMDVIQSLGDDAAVMAVPSGAGQRLLFTTDMLLEGGHFTRSAGGEKIGHKALACSISDIAAMGGLPTYAVVSVGVPSGLAVRFLEDIYRGMRKLARKFGVRIIGGDTVRSKKIIINVALLGEVSARHLVLRSGAKNGNCIFVTGPLGRSLKSGKHLTFLPRIKESQYLIKNFKPTAMIDISDGLIADLGHVLQMSRKSADLYAEQIPLNRGAILQNAFYDGEDFEILFTLPIKDAARLMKSKENRARFRYIGRIKPGLNRVNLIDRDGRSKNIPIQGFQHF